MLTLVATLIYCGLLIVVGRLLFKVAWGITKFIAGFLLALSIPILIVCLLIGGLSLLAPVGLLFIAIIVLFQ